MSITRAAGKYGRTLVGGTAVDEPSDGRPTELERMEDTARKATHEEVGKGGGETPRPTGIASQANAAVEYQKSQLEDIEKAKETGEVPKAKGYQGPNLG